MDSEKGRPVYLDQTSYAPGGGWNEPWCRACKEPIQQGQRSTRVIFSNDPGGMRGLTGDYHAACSKPFASMAHALDMLSRYGR